MSSNIILSPLFALLFSPLLIGIINKTKAFFAGRKGAPLLQMYYDLFRLFRKGTVLSGTTSFIFKIAPAIIFSTTLAATTLIPLISSSAGLSFTGDFILLFYLLGMARLFLILSAWDTGSSFEGMGASREAFFSALAEPALFISVLTILRLRNTVIFFDALSSGPGENWIILLLVTVPLFIIMLAENARIPFDDPNTHLELTMIHEVMILDNSGPGLAFLEYAASVKLWLFSLLIVRIVCPFSSLIFPLELLFVLLCVFLISVIIGVVESTLARVYMMKVPQLLFSAGIISFLGFFLSFSKVMVW